jgi:hypothetical protein
MASAWKSPERAVSSCLDLVTLLRKQLAQTPQTLATGSAPPTYHTMIEAAVA